MVNLAQTGKIRMLVEHVPLERVGAAYQLLHDGKIKGRAVITPNDTRGVSPDASADADASTPTAGAHAHIEIGYRRFR